MHPSIVMGVERFKHHYNRGSLREDHFERERFFDLRQEDTTLKERVAFPNKKAMLEKFDNSEFVGDKYPNMVRKFDLLQAHFPAPRFLFILRNPVFVARSWQVRADRQVDPWPAKNDFNAGLDYWLDSLHRVTKAWSGGILVTPVDYDLLTAGDTSDAGKHLDQLFHAIGATLSSTPLEGLLSTRQEPRVNRYSDEEAGALASLLQTSIWQDFMGKANSLGFHPPAWSADPCNRRS
jgi:hypothetical protein